MFVDNDFHFVDARLEKKNFTGQTRGAVIIEGNDGVQCAVHGAFHQARHGDQIVDEGVVKNDFGQASDSRHWVNLRGGICCSHTSRS